MAGSESRVEVLIATDPALVGKRVRLLFGSSPPDGASGPPPEASRNAGRIMGIGGANHLPAAIHDARRL